MKRVNLVKDVLLKYVERVKTLHERVRGNEQATKHSLINPLFAILGYDLADPQECIPEFRADFGKDRSVKPVDWAFCQNSQPIFLVEAKDAGRRLEGFDEQLFDYFGKVQPNVRLGILSNGVMWRFFTDSTHDHVMDKEPFLQWDVLKDEQPPFDFLTLLQKSRPFDAEEIRKFAEKKRAHDFLIIELTRLLEPAPEFTKLAIQNIEKKSLTPSRLEAWKPVVAGAIEEWVNRRTASSVFSKAPSLDDPTSRPEQEIEEVEPLRQPSVAQAKRYELRKRFWAGLLSRPKVKNTRHASISPSEYSWIAAGSGVGGVPFSYNIGQGEARVELWINRGAGKAAENKEIFDSLHKHKKEVEKSFGGELSWQRLDSKQGCRIAYTTTVGGYKSDESKWPEIQDAMIDAMIRLEKALTPHLEALELRH